MESKKRKLPARASTRTSLSKKRNSTPPEQVPAPPPAPVVEEGLPKSIVAGKPLPTVEQLQPDDLPNSQYQTVAESGVMAESLERSRKKWLSEGIFEKYWTKPLKKKGLGPEELASNPSKDSMTKLGPCTITIEPHVFDAVMYAVKDTTPRQLYPPQQPLYRPIIQYGPPGGTMSQHLPPAPAQPTQFQNTQPATPLAARPHEHPGRPPSNNTPSSMTPNAPPSASGNVPLQSPHTAAPNPQAQPTPQPPAEAAPSPAPASRTSDPVIQMLAERAATDQELKGLMRIVADGKASPEQLKQFQSHIDELTKVLNARSREEKARTTTAAGATPPSTASPAQHTPAPNNARPSPAPLSGARPAHPSPLTNGHHAQPQPQALRSKGPLPPSKPDISAVVFEFNGGSGDRFLFPKYSILEYLPGGQVIASFLIVRKGSAADSKKYDPALDYYQPMTIRLYTHQGRQLESLAKVVAPPDEVRKYMDDIMDNMTRAEYVLLAMRLPKEGKESGQGTPVEEASSQSDQSNNQVLWTSANGTATKQKAVKKPPTEEEQYQTFITTVS